MSFLEFGGGKTLLRSVLVFIILGTIPFYGLGVILLANSNGSDTPEESIGTTATFTPLGADQTLTPTATTTPTRFITATPDQGPVGSTPFQFVPPTARPTNTPTPVILPTDTPAPTLTPNVDRDGDGILDHNDACPNRAGPAGNNGCPRPASATPRPTNTPLPPASDTPVPTATPTQPATATPQPTSTPRPTNTPLPTATPRPTNTVAPTNTPVPTATPQPTSTPTDPPTPTQESTN